MRLITLQQLIYRVRLFYRRELNTERLYLYKHILQVYQSAFDYRLQEHTNQPDHPVFVDFGLIGTATLLHAVFEEYMYELLRQFDVAAQSVEDLEGVRTQLHLGERVIVLGDLSRMGHTDEELEGDVWVVDHDVRQTLSRHADVED